MAQIIGDLQLLIQTILYFGSCLAGLATCIPLGVTSVDFQGNCILYGDAKWFNQTHFTFTFGGKANCNFSVYFTVFACVLYGMAMGCYHTYAVCRARKDPNIGSQMWAMPFIMANALITVLLFISSCIISIGFVEWCNSLVDGAKKVKNAIIHSCSDGQNAKIKWTLNGVDYDGSSFYTFLTGAQLASWIAFLIGLAQVSLCILRYYRNRRQRSLGQSQTIQGDAPTTDSDRQDISKVEPTA